MKITCPVLQPNDFLPAKYTCDGKGVNPPLEISDIPQEAKSLALIMDDPDAPRGTFTHWLVWNIHPVISKIEENSVPLDAVEGMNSANQEGYIPPCPPGGTHRYRFKLYALDQYLSLEKKISRSDLENEIEKHLVDSAELVTQYQRL
jgi:Raf kinase inhibitor-like YbhB/YbcL family protein